MKKYMKSIDWEKLNEQFKIEFEKCKCYRTFEKYVMSELMPPIDDYYNAMELIEQYDFLLEDRNLLYIAAYLSAGWKAQPNLFLEKINSFISNVGDYEKAIIYYLNAYNISFADKDWKNSEEYKSNLLKSVIFSQGYNFVYNYYELAQIAEKEKYKSYMEEAHRNVQKVETEESLKEKDVEFWLSSQRYIDEYILGTSLPVVVYLHMFEDFVKDRIVSLVNKWDPIGLYPMAPKDEYESEIKKICEFLFNNSHVEEKLLANYINEIFVQSFGKDIYREDLVKCEKIARKILLGSNFEK